MELLATLELTCSMSTACTTYMIVKQNLNTNNNCEYYKYWYQYHGAVFLLEEELVPDAEADFALAVILAACNVAGPLGR